MGSHLRACAWLIGLTVVLCAVLYPLALLGLGRAGFPEKAGGSLLTDGDKVVGSRLIAQPFSADEYFWPRPSAASYNAAASAATNWGANNPLLRNRVARQLGPIVRYDLGAEKYSKKPGERVGPDIEVWFRANRYKGKEGIVAQWLGLYPAVAEAWVKDTGDALKEQTGKDTPAQAFAAQWSKDFPRQYTKWRQQNPDKDEPTPGDLANPFFEGFIEDHAGAWPFLDDVTANGKTLKKIVPLKEEKEDKKRTEIQGVFFDLWRQDHPEVPLEEVPADMVMASGSGLDPHITLDNARYQLKYRVAGAWADKLIKEGKIQADEAQAKQIRDHVREDIVKLLNDHASSPLGGLVGVPLVNVLEVNLALRDRMRELGKKLW